MPDYGVSPQTRQFGACEKKTHSATSILGAETLLFEFVIGRFEELRPVNRRHARDVSKPIPIWGRQIGRSRYCPFLNCINSSRTMSRHGRRECVSHS